MALSRSFLSKAILHLQSKACLGTTRYLSSSSSTTTADKTTDTSNEKASKASHSKKSETARRRRAIVVESFVKTYMEKHPGVFPNIKHVQHEVGGSWQLLKSILADLKLKTEENCQTEKLITNISSDFRIDTIAFNATHTNKNLDISKLEVPESRVQASEAVIDPCSHGNNNATWSTSHFLKNSSGEVVKSEVSADVLKIFEPDNGQKQVEEGISGKVIGPDRDDKRTSEQVSFLSHASMRKEKVTRLLGKDVSEGISVGHGSHGSNQMVMTTGLAPNASSKVYNMDASCRLSKLHASIKSDEAAEGDTRKENDQQTLTRFSDIPNQIRKLLNSIKEAPTQKPSTMSHEHNTFKKMNQTNSTDPLRSKSIPAFNFQQVCEGRQMQLSDKTTIKGNNQQNKNREESETEIAFELSDSSEDGSGSDSEIASFDYVTSEPSPSFPGSITKGTPKMSSDVSLSTKRGTDENKLLLRFLHKRSKTSDIISAFVDCGPIAEVREIPSQEEGKFRDVYIHFNTKEGLQKAMDKSDVVIGPEDVILVAPASENIQNKIDFSDLIGDVDVPTRMVKNPTRTVKIRPLAQGITLHQLRDALSFCGGCISSFIMGYSSSIAYIEFETEDAKEKAIAAHSISISGKQIQILRIDIPRTTVVRISNLQGIFTTAKISAIFSSHGKVKRIVTRCKGTVDVHFKLVEWPNMVNILNSLNGMVVDGCRWHAQPATVIPVGILYSLWSQPDERKHVRMFIQDISQKLERNSMNTSGLVNLISRYHSDEI